VIIYKKEEQKLPATFTNLISIDLGVNNLAAKREEFVRTHRIRSLQGKRNRYVHNFLHQASRKIVDLITYKAELLGITVVKQNEAYTSGCSALDEEKIAKKAYAPKRRIHRGLFVSNSGFKINADVNGSLNILRKYLGGKGSEAKVAGVFNFTFGTLKTSVLDA
ncbi:zinc ribbon domain-containing protein, partial [Brevibacillus massiliensis]|uniref:zinc ribbon domain-containing protein n=1 Tax=Brevibacillus massiliensis TaxID=1118054 RepID=UPI00037C0336